MGVTIIKDATPELLAAVKRLLKQECLVGVPDINAAREPDPSDPANDINNAQLGYIHEFGSPAANVPARPFLIPGIESVKDKITDRLKKAGEKALSGDVSEIDKQLVAVGLLAVDAVQQKIIDGPFEPLSPVTIMLRWMRKQNPNMKMGKTAVWEAIARVKRGESPGNVRTDPLRDKGALFQSITYAIRNR